MYSVAISAAKFKQIRYCQFGATLHEIASHFSQCLDTSNCNLTHITAARYDVKKLRRVKTLRTKWRNRSCYAETMTAICTCHAKFHILCKAAEFGLKVGSGKVLGINGLNKSKVFNDPRVELYAGPYLKLHSTHFLGEVAPFSCAYCSNFFLKSLHLKW